jgi:hypothetical protein
MGRPLYKHGLDVVAILNPASPALVREALAVLVAVEAVGTLSARKLERVMEALESEWC